MNSWYKEHWLINILVFVPVVELLASSAAALCMIAKASSRTGRLTDWATPLHSPPPCRINRKYQIPMHYYKFQHIINGQWQGFAESLPFLTIPPCTQVVSHGGWCQVSNRGQEESHFTLSLPQSSFTHPDERKIPTLYSLSPQSTATHGPSELKHNTICRWYKENFAKQIQPTTHVFE